MLIHHMFTAQARRTPDAIAVVGLQGAYTYAELDAITSRVAADLVRAGVRVESIVGCSSHDSISTVIQILAVLKAGGAYLLLDPHLPTARLRYMVEDADPVLILGDGPGMADVHGHRPVLTMDVAPSSEAVADCDVLPVGVGAENLAYAAYTSGSTGRPKGALITHAAVANHAAAFRDQFDLRPGDRLPLMAPIAFDMATEEILPPLVSGCTLLDAPHRTPSMQQFTDDVLTSGYTILNIPAPLWHQWTTHLQRIGSAVPPSLRLMIVGSDKIYTAKLHEWQSLAGAEDVWWVAAYGVTEATVTSLLYLTAAQDDLRDEPLVPIGTAISGVTAHVVGDDGGPAGIGEIGELYIGGAGLARGYRNLPDKTAERFVRNALGSMPGARCYRTGDLARRRPDGSIVWLGRRDSQIKINGLRIEPAEIEAMIYEYPAVAEAIVTFTPPSVVGESGRLVAHVEVAEGKSVDVEALSTFLGARLHPLMLPDEIVMLDRIPLNANGKLDRKALQVAPVSEVS
jgi:amino acid adenylation domain-containing protein